MCIRDRALTPQELASAEAGFERRAAELGRREMNWDDVKQVPELMGLLCHPALMAVVDGFCKRLGHEAVLAGLPGARQGYNPTRQDRDEPLTGLPPAGRANSAALANNPAPAKSRQSFSSRVGRRPVPRTRPVVAPRPGGPSFMKGSGGACGQWTMRAY